mmetsp:Transcript_68538/g.203910  ORF Transcript_68538/g.203910 Transcript_68538/m.203910 type:complete len:254 (-) Transcript_68538:258-1019(-)
MIRPITVSSSSELATFVSTILPMMMSTFSGQILFSKLFTERFNSFSRLPDTSCRNLYAVAEGAGNVGAGLLLELLLLLAPVREPASRGLRPESRSRWGMREPKSLRSEGSPAPTAADSAPAADGVQALSSSRAQKLARPPGAGPAALRKASSDLRDLAPFADLEASSSAPALLGLALPAVISTSSESEEGAQVSSSTSWAPCFVSVGLAVLLEEATLWSDEAAGWRAGRKVALASVSHSSSSQPPSSSRCADR